VNDGGRIATMIGGLPGMSAIATHMMEKKMAELDISPIPEFIEMISDTGAGIYACKASVDMFEPSKDDFVDEGQGIITVGKFYELAAGGEIIFT
jgi:peroxiredoxin family protein